MTTGSFSRMRRGQRPQAADAGPMVTAAWRRFRVLSADGIAVAAAILVTFAMAVWIVSPRFAIDGPSLVDDWSSLDNSRPGLDGVVHLDYDAAGANDTYRYRPGFTAVWNSLQWRTLGAPRSMTGPNAWELLRILLFLAGAAGITAFALRTGAVRHVSPASLGMWSAVPGLLLLATPSVSLDLARMGPGEPLLIGGLACGAALMTFALARTLGGSRARRSTLVTALLALSGITLWLLGVYVKEASICFLVFAPFLYLAVDRAWRARGLIVRPLWRYRAFQVTAAAMLLPLLHMAIEVKRISNGNTVVYGATVPSGPGGWITRLWDSATSQWMSAGLLGTGMWRALAIAVPFLLVAATIRRGRPPLVGTGLIVLALAVFLFQGLANVQTARYYIPVVVLLAPAVVVLLTDAPAWLRAVALLGVAAFLIHGGTEPRKTVSDWSKGEQGGHQTVAAIARLNPRTCPVYMGLMHLEEADALGELVAREPGGSGPCKRGYAALLAQGKTTQQPVTNEAIYRACARPWKVLANLPAALILGCRTLTRRPIYGQRVEDVLRWDRLIPGTRLSQRLPALRKQLSAKSADTHR